MRSIRKSPEDIDNQQRQAAVGGVKVGGSRWKRGNQEGNEVQAVKVWVLGEEKQIRGWRSRAGCWEVVLCRGLGLGGAARRLWNQQSSCDCSCQGSHIKAPESVNLNEL